MMTVSLDLAEGYAAATGTLTATLEILATRLKFEAEYSENQELKDFLEKQIKFINESLAEAEAKKQRRVA